MLEEKYAEEEFWKKSGRISDATLGKLPPLCQDGRNTSQRHFRQQPDFQQDYMEERGRKMTTIYEQQQQTAIEKVRKMFQHKYSLQRQYHSARDRYDSIHQDEQDYNNTMWKTSGTDKAFPPKSAYYKRAYSLSNIHRPNTEHVEPLEAERLARNVPVQNLDYPDWYGGRSGRRGSERQLPENQVVEMPAPSSFGVASTRCRGRARGSQWQEGQLEDDQARLEEQIRRKEIALQQKLQRVVEELGKIQREKCTPAGTMGRRERLEVGSERAKWEKEKERRECEKAAHVEQERRGRREKDKERERWAQELDRERERAKEDKWDRHKRDRERANASELEKGRREREQERKERVWDGAHRRRTQEKHCENLQRDSGRNGCISRRTPPEASRRRPMRVIEETPGQQAVEQSPHRGVEAVSQHLPCSLCQRNFAADRLEKHRMVCEKVQRSTRKVFDSSKYRAKGTDLETFMMTNTRRRSPELKKSNWRKKHEAFIHNLRQARMPANGASRPQPLMDDQDYQTCPHCARRFAPGPAERHIPLCQNIRSRPPPPPRHFNRIN